MKLLEFLNELKHRSLSITLVDSEGRFIYSTEIGQYIHWIRRNDYDDLYILNIIPSDKSFTIQLDTEGD